MILDDASNAQVFEIVEDGEPEVGYVPDVPAEDVAMEDDKDEIEGDDAEVDGPVCKKLQDQHTPSCKLLVAQKLTMHLL